MFPKGFKKVMTLLIALTLAPFFANGQKEFNIVKKKLELFELKGKQGLKHKSNIIIPARFDSIFPFQKNYVLVCNNHLCGIYHIGKGLIIPCLYDGFNIINDTLILTSLRGKYGLVTLNYKTLLDPIYKKIEINGYGNTVIQHFKKIKVVSSESTFEIEADSMKERSYGYDFFYNGCKVSVSNKGDTLLQVSDVQESPALKPIETLPDHSIKTINFDSVGIYGDFSCDTLFEGLFSGSMYWDDSLLIYQTGNRFGLADISPNVLTMPEYQEINPLNRKFLKFKKDGVWGIMDRKGRVVTDTLYDCLQPVTSHKYCKVSLAGKQGIIGYNGLVIIPPYYSYIQKDSSENIYTFYHQGKYLALIDTTGEQLLDTNYHYQEIKKFKNGYARVKKFDKYGFINKRGGLTIATQYHKVCDKVVQERASVLIKGKWALVNSWEKMLAQPYYDSIGHFSDSVVIAVKNKKYLLLDYYGQELCGAKFEKIVKFNSGNYIIISGGKCGVMQKNGNELIFTKYDAITGISKRYIAVKSFDKYGVVNYFGKEIVPIEYEQVILTNRIEGYVLVKNVARSIVKF